MVPADQVLNASHPIRAQIENRLVVELELLLRERITQIKLELSPGMHLPIHFH
jgi:hypothetical protein